MLCKVVICTFECRSPALETWSLHDTPREYPTVILNAYHVSNNLLHDGNDLEGLRLATTPTILVRYHSIYEVEVMAYIWQSE